MKLSPAGRLVAWLALGLLIVGLVFYNQMLIAPAILLLLYLLFEGISFRRAVNTFIESVTLESDPSHIEATVGRAYRIETLLTNASNFDFRIMDLRHNLPAQIEQEIRFPSRLSPYGQRRIQTLLKTKTPGRFDVRGLTVFLEDRMRLFDQSVNLPHKLSIVAWPVVNRSGTTITSEAPYDLAVDHIRHGTGTDLAGIRPCNFLDDFQRIDWKATARTGKLMTRDFHSEREPAILLMIDVSTSMRAAGGGSILNSLLEETGRLLATIRPSSPMGLILFDERTVTASVQAEVGLENREIILHTLLQRANAVSIAKPYLRAQNRSYAELARETRSLTAELASAAKTLAYSENLSSFAREILPYYREAEAKHLRRIKREGVFRAFEIIRTLPEPVLVIAISDGMTNLDGLSQGARYAAMLKHRVVLAIMAHPKKPPPFETLSDLERFGIRILTCNPEELCKAVVAAILDMSHMRTIPVEGPR